MGQVVSAWRIAVPVTGALALRSLPDGARRQAAIQPAAWA
jgi:hypothetical protein